ncbi:ladinin-1 [Myripristis murdjan]|uniref:ladinin-1 n=1 Tax=Myripristis murdjan TaxID=586833 RepID=UPI001175FB00|nr:ladinin-1 [Myripristis murdjan]XP_029911751.1 ladinin-1 [Myripristis murdjan]
MSISRKNWSALSSLARQWTMEDEEEVEREKRRRVRCSSSTTDDPDTDPSPDLGPTRRDTPTTDSTRETDSSYERSQGPSSVEQLQLDFVEMLRVRDEKRRMRHVETLRRQKEEEEDEEGADKAGTARVELLGDVEEEEGGVAPSVFTRSKPAHVPIPAPHSPASTTVTNRQHENGECLGKDPDTKPPATPSRKFVSSVSISLDKSPSTSGRTTPMSPRSPTAPRSPREHWPSPCQSPSPRGAQNSMSNGHTQETSDNGSSSSGSANFEPVVRPAFARQSSRTVSFRMIRKKEEDNSPLQRSSSVRMASKKFESSTDQNQDEDKKSPFQRSSKQRLSSRAIQEKMERLAQAAQKSEVVRSPDVTHRALFLLDEVSRKRGLFEKEQPPPSSTSPGVSRQEFRSFTSGMSDRINRWLNKTNPAASSHIPTDVRHVDITSKRSLFESRGEADVSKGSSGKTYK